MMEKVISPSYAVVYGVLGYNPHLREMLTLRIGTNSTWDIHRSV